VVFSNLVFLYIFLPVILLTYFIAPRIFKNTILLIASLFFYAWGEPKYILLMIFSIFANYIFGIAVFKTQNPSPKKIILIFSVITNLLILGYFKYATFFIDNINYFFNTEFSNEPIPLPIGISFFTFQAMSYVIDVYRKDAPVQKNFLDLSLYIALFPQLVAGPIVRYNTVAAQIKERFTSIDTFSLGVRRFIIGLSKKVLIANPLGAIADEIFSLSQGDLTTATAWIGIIAYTLQIYFDFSGYSDMAIGLGKMFGFDFEENFRYPYISRSISEFWRRWHISLGNWFRDYVYIPLGGNRGNKLSIYRNLLIVWTITGFWHGASWTFMAWGFYYGLIICVEKLGLEQIIHSLWKPLQHIYVLVIVMIGWVFFRADNFSYSFAYLKALFGKAPALYNQQSLLYLVDNGYLIIIACILCTPVYFHLIRMLNSAKSKLKGTTVVIEAFSSLTYLLLFLIVTMYLVNSTYNPFIYFRF